MSFANRTVSIKCKTWSRDSYGLFDHECASLKVSKISATKSGKVCRSGPEINYVEQGVYNKQQSSLCNVLETGEFPEVVAHISESHKGIEIYPDPKHPDEQYRHFWTIVKKDTPTDGYLLQKDDIIKLGRVVFQIRKIKLQDQDETTSEESNKKMSLLDSIKEHLKNDDHELFYDSGSTDKKNSMSSNSCKICLNEVNSYEDPLIHPCKCEGSVKYVHLTCIQKWVKSKMNMLQNKNIITIFWKNLNCELCKAKLPLNYSHQGRELHLIPFNEKIKGSYVLLESFSKDKEPSGIHVIDLTGNDNFKMGRGHDCDLKITDISVSRVHAFLTTYKGQLYLKDNRSKFGTLVLKNGPYVINDNEPKSPWIQFGRTIFKFSIKKPWLSFLPCFNLFYRNQQSEVLLSDDRIRMRKLEDSHKDDDNHSGH